MNSIHLTATNTFTVTVREVNLAPTLPAQADRSVNELETMTVVNTAGDTDLPANGLSYVLTEAPTGAAVRE